MIEKLFESDLLNDGSWARLDKGQIVVITPEHEVILVSRAGVPLRIECDGPPPREVSWIDNRMLWIA